MQHTDLESFAAIIVGLGELYGRQFSTPAIQLYWEALKDFPLEDIQRAARAYLNNPDSGQFCPKPADLIRMLSGNSQTQALQAWAKVERAVRTVGAWQSVVFDDPIIHAVVRDMGGWIALCKVSVDELPFRAKEFENRYRGFVLDPPRDYPRSLVGQAEAMNAQQNQAIAPPVVIGNVEKARLAYRAGASDSNTGPMITRQASAIAERMRLAPPEPEPELEPMDRSTAIAKIRALTVVKTPAAAGTDQPQAAKPEPFHPDPKRRAELQAALEAAMGTRKESA